MNETKKVKSLFKPSLYERFKQSKLYRFSIAMSAVYGLFGFAMSCIYGILAGVPIGSMLLNLLGIYMILPLMIYPVGFMGLAFIAGALFSYLMFWWKEWAKNFGYFYQYGEFWCR